MKKLIADQPDLLLRYSDSILDSFVDDNKRVKWCELCCLQLQHQRIVCLSQRFILMPACTTMEAAHALEVSHTLAGNRVSSALLQVPQCAALRAGGG